MLGTTAAFFSRRRSLFLLACAVLLGRTLSSCSPVPSPRLASPRLLFTCLFFRGDLKQALKCYARTRDYCTTNRHSAEMCLHVIEVRAIFQHFWMCL